VSEQRVEAVERALSLLECFREDRQTLSLAEMAEISGMYKSTILRLAASLERFGYLVRREDGVFRLGPAVQRLGAIYRLGFNLERLIRPELLRLVQLTGETASFYVRDGDARVCLYRENSTRAARHHLDEGALLTLATGASGHVLRAFGKNPDPAEAAVREAGYALSLGERDPDLAAIAMPVVDRKGTLYGALSVSGIITRFTEERRIPMLEALGESVARLKQRLD
jgi:DNA-binding IclR family transcriptional regulator